MSKAIFLDRDGTIIEEMGYINHFSRIKPLPEAVKAIKLLKKLGFKIIVITNQAGVAKGYFNERQLVEMNNWMLELFEKKGASIDGLYYCPHHPEGKIEQYRIDCHCRKPKPGMVKKAVVEFGIDLTKSFIIGDRLSDIALAKSLRMFSIFVLTGYGTGEYVRNKGNLSPKPDLILNNILQAAQVINKFNLMQN